MLLSIYPKISKQTPIYIYDWSKAIIDAGKLLEYHTNRFKDMDFVLNNITKKIKDIIALIDLDELNSFDNDLDLYLSYIETNRFKIEFDINGLFPSGVRGPWLNNYSTYETCIPVHSTNPMSRLPMDKGWEEGWDKIKPIKIQYHDSIELSYNVQNKLNFIVFNPTIFIWSVDVTKFIFKYLRYTQFNTDINATDGYVDKYVYHELYLPIIEDIFNIWILNIMDRIISADDFGDIELLIDSQFNKYIPPSLSKGIKSTWDNLVNVSNGTTTFEKFCHTKYFNNRSLMEVIKDLLLENRVYNLVQYRHHEVLLELPYIKLLYTLSKKNKHISGHRNIDVSFERFIANYISNRIYKRFRSQAIDSYVENCLYWMNDI